MTINPTQVRTKAIQITEARKEVPSYSSLASSHMTYSERTKCQTETKPTQSIISVPTQLCADTR